MSKLIVLDNYNSDICSFYEYLRFYAPGIVSDFSGAFSFLTSEKNATEKIQILKDCLSTKDFLENNREHIKGFRQSAYDAYKAIADKDFLLNKSDFCVIYNSVCGIEFNGQGLSCKPPAVTAAALLNSLEEPKEKLQEYLADLRITSSASSVADSQAKSIEDYNRKLTVFKDVLAKLKHNPEYWRDALCALHTDLEYNDVELENKFIYFSFSSFVRSTDSKHTVHIIDPSPFFIRQWMADSFLSKINTTFVLKNLNTLQLLQFTYPDSELVQLISFDEYDSILSRGVAELTLLFGSHLDSLQSKITLVKNILDNSRDKHRLFILDSDSALNSIKESCFTKSLINIDSIDLLPADINNATYPKRKSFVHISFGYIDFDENHRIPVRSHQIVKNGKYQMLSSKVFETEISQRIYLDNYISLRNLFRTNLRKSEAKSNAHRERANVYQFSKEIRFHYTCFGKAETVRIRACASILDPINGRFIKDNLAILEKRSIKQADTERWLEEKYPFGIIKKADGVLYSIREQIIQAMLPRYYGKTITLKTFLYIHPELTNTLTESIIKNLQFICCNIEDHDLSRISTEKIETSIEAAVNAGVISGSIASALSALKAIFDFAISQGHCRFNPIQGIPTNTAERYDELDEVNDAVGKHFLTEKEFRQIVLLCAGKIHVGKYEYLAVLLRLFTGLEANILCALQIKDFTISESSGIQKFHQLEIVRQVSASGNEFIPFKRAEQVRTIPLPNFVAEIINNIMASYKSDHLDLDANQLMNLPIIPGGDTPVSMSVKIVAPAQINRICKDLLTGLNVPENYIPIPDNKYGILDDNLSAFRGDIYKNSFRHYLIRESNIELGELNYILGIKAPNVDYGSYIDCSHQRKQLRIYESMEKLTNKFIGGLSNE